MCVCVRVRGCVCCAVDIYSLSSIKSTHRAADSGSLRSGGELAHGMKVLTLLARSLLQDATSQILLQAPQVDIHSQAESTQSQPFFFFPFSNVALFAGRSEGMNRTTL